MKYNEKDFEKVVKGKATTDDLCKKYGVSYHTLMMAMSRKKFYLKKKKIKITSPYKTKIVHSCSECANELQVSIETIRNALKGKRIKCFEEMNVKIEVVEL